MSKRKLATKSKHGRDPIAAKAQRAAQAVVRSPKDKRRPAIGVASIEALPVRHNEQEAFVGDPTTTASQQEAHLEPAIASQQEAPLEPATALQNKRNEDSTKGFDFSSVSANVRAFQGKLLEVANENMQFAFEFAQKLAAIRSPAEFLSVTAEFTSKRSAMFRRHSKELAELSAVLVLNRKEKLSRAAKEVGKT
jgi:Phasin protein